MEITVSATESRWGDSSFNSGGRNDKLKVGRNSAGVNRYGYLKFPAIPSDWQISKMILHLYKEDEYPNNSRNLLFGGTADNGFNATLSFSFTSKIDAGNGERKLTLTSYVRTIQGFSGDNWYIHIRNGDTTTNSYCEFHGPAASTLSKRPYLEIEYQQGSMHYGVDGNWVQCAVYYGVGNEWIQVLPHYGINNNWQQV